MLTNTQHKYSKFYKYDVDMMGILFCFRLKSVIAPFDVL